MRARSFTDVANVNLGAPVSDPWWKSDSSSNCCSDSLEAFERSAMVRQRLLGLGLSGLESRERIVERSDLPAATRQCARQPIGWNRPVPTERPAISESRLSRRVVSVVKFRDHVILSGHAGFEPLRDLAEAACSRSPATRCSRTRSPSARWRLKMMRFSARSSSSAACPIRL